MRPTSHVRACPQYCRHAIDSAKARPSIIRSSLRAALLVVTAGLTAGVSANPATEWTVVAKGQYASDVLIPGWPQDEDPYHQNWEERDIRLSDTGQQRIHLSVLRNGAIELWRSAPSGLALYASVDSDAETGPSRTGSEAGHVFRSLFEQPVDMGGHGVIAFSGRAGPPAPTALDFATYGLWLATPDGNVEIARGRNYVTGQTANPLDPGTGNLRFSTSGNFVKKVWMLDDDLVLFAATIVNPDTATSRLALVRHLRGVGNQICAISGEYLGQVVPFSDWQVQVSRGGEIYVDSQNYGHGFWRICEGPGIPLVKENATGLLGPGLPSPTAYFPYPTVGLQQFAVSDTGSIIFGGRVSDSTAGAWTGSGIFRNTPTGNQPLALTNVLGPWGSGLPEMPFKSLSAYNSPKISGEYALFGATVQTQASEVEGLWRILPNGTVEAAALEGTAEDGLSPEPGKVWGTLTAHDAGIYSNGDIVLKASARPDAHDALWLLRPGAEPQRLLSIGDTIKIPTAAGMTDATVNSFMPANPFSRGDEAADAAMGSDGSLLLKVYVSQPRLGPVFVLRQLGVSEDIFMNGFE